jgi:hypothetical protein
MNRTDALEILRSHLDETASEDEDFSSDQAVEEYAYEAAGYLVDNDDNEVNEAIRTLAG